MAPSFVNVAQATQLVERISGTVLDGDDLRRQKRARIEDMRREVLAVIQGHAMDATEVANVALGMAGFAPVVEGTRTIINEVRGKLPPPGQAPGGPKAGQGAGGGATGRPVGRAGAGPGDPLGAAPLARPGQEVSIFARVDPPLPDAGAQVVQAGQAATRPRGTKQPPPGVVHPIPTTAAAGPEVRVKAPPLGWIQPTGPPAAPPPQLPPAQLHGYFGQASVAQVGPALQHGHATLPRKAAPTTQAAQAVVAPAMAQEVRSSLAWLGGDPAVDAPAVQVAELAASSSAAASLPELPPVQPVAPRHADMRQKLVEELERQRAAQEAQQAAERKRELEDLAQILAAADQARADLLWLAPPTRRRLHRSGAAGLGASPVATGAEHRGRLQVGRRMRCRHGAGEGGNQGPPHGPGP